MKELVSEIPEVVMVKIVTRKRRESTMFMFETEYKEKVVMLCYVML